MSFLYIVLILIFVTIVCIIQLPLMIEKNLDKEKWVFSILMIIGTVISIMRSLGISITNPNEIVAKVYSPITNLIEKYLK